MGRPGGARGGGRVPRLPRLRLRPRAPAGRRWGMAGPITRFRPYTAPSPVTDWLVLLGVLGVIARVAVGGVTFMPAAGFGQNRRPPLTFEQAGGGRRAGAPARGAVGGRGPRAPARPRGP